MTKKRMIAAAAGVLVACAPEKGVEQAIGESAGAAGSGAAPNGGGTAGAGGANGGTSALGGTAGTGSTGGTPSGGGNSGCAVQVALGEEHSCARRSDGTLWCWGSNLKGQIGDGTTGGESCAIGLFCKPKPLEVSVLGTSVAEVALGYWHTCARRLDGSLWCWGANGYGSLGDGTTAQKQSPVQVVSIGTNVGGFALGYMHTCARKVDGSVWCWGYNVAGSLGDGTTNDSNAPVATLIGNVSNVALGGGRSAARKADGSVWEWGANVNAPQAVVALGNAVAEIAVGSYHSCARKTDGTLWCWGSNQLGQLGDGTTMDRPSPVQVKSLGNGVTKVALGGVHSCARKSDGSLWCWGENSGGQLGDGTTTGQPCSGSVCRPSPMAVIVLGTGVADVALGGYHSCALMTDASLRCWGANGLGQLGVGTTGNLAPVPQNVSLPCP